MTLSYRRARARYSVSLFKSLSCIFILSSVGRAVCCFERSAYYHIRIVSMVLWGCGSIQPGSNTYRQLLLDISSRSHTCLCTCVTFEHWILEYQCS